MAEPNVFPAGVIQLLQWTMMPDGTQYMNVWAPSWWIITNKASGIEGLHTTDRFHVATYASDGRLLAIFPGCQVKGFAACDANPSYKGGTQAYTMGG